MPHAVGKPKTKYVFCPDCGKKKRWLPSHKSEKCLKCVHLPSLLRHRKDIENMGKCLDCGTKIARFSFRCHPCDGVRAAASPNYLENRRIYRSLSARLRGALAEFRITKRESTIKYLGCSLEELKIYLESKFKDGMTWENYGMRGWHIDHIRPVSLFDLTDEQQVSVAFHYSNLQPLWARENIVKSNKIV